MNKKMAREIVESLPSLYPLMTADEEEAIWTVLATNSNTENDGDCISRRQAIDAVTDELDMIDHVPQWVFDRLEKRLKQLPNVQHEPCEDAVSREEVLNCLEWQYPDKLPRTKIMELPPVTPKQPKGVMPVKCRECVYRIKMKYNSKFDCEKGHGVNWTEFYCADGRRERDD